MSVKRTLFRNVRIFDPAVGGTHVGGWLLVEGGRIAAVGEGSADFDDAEVFEGDGRTLMPGLIDCLADISSATAPSSTSETLSTGAEIDQIGALRRMLASGFTSVRLAGHMALAIREAIRYGHISGPRLFVTSAAIQPHDPRDKFHAVAGGANVLRCQCSNPEAGLEGLPPDIAHVRSLVRERLRDGSDCLTLTMSPGGPDSPGETSSRPFTIAAISAAVQEAQVFGRDVAATAHTANDIALAARAGIRTIELGTHLDRAGARLMYERGTLLIPIVASADGMSAMAIARSAGVAIAFGTGSASVVQNGAAEELMLRAKIDSPLAILRSATCVAAALLRMDGQLGTLAIGANADFLVVDGDPLDDIRLIAGAANKIHSVFKGGNSV